MKYVKKFKLWGEEVFIKDEEARNGLAEANQRIDGVPATILDAIAENNSKTLESRYTITREQYNNLYKYVSLAGSDETGDGTQEKPYRTFEKCFKDASTESVAFNIYVMTAGTYDISNINFSLGSIHIRPMVAGVVLNLTDSFAMYNTHLNLGVDDDTKRMTVISSTSNSYWHFDGGQLYAHHVDFNCYLEVNGCGTILNKCSVANLHVRACNAVINDLNLLTPVRTDHGAMNFEGALVKMQGTLTTSLGSNTTVPMIQLRSGVFVMGSDWVALTTGRYPTAFDSNYGVLLSTNAHVRSLANCCLAVGTATGVISNINLEEYTPTF